MAILLTVLAGLLALMASVLAVAAPTVLAKNYQRWSRLTLLVAFVVMAWIATGAVRALNIILQILQDKGIGPDSALHSVRTLASEGVNEQRALGPALVALLVAGAYTEILGKNRARSLSGNAA